MGLDELTNDVGMVSSRRDIDNYTLPKSEWKWLIMHDPFYADMWCDGDNPEEIRMWVELIDDLIENGHKRGDPTDDQVEELRNYRQKLIGKL